MRIEFTSTRPEDIVVGAMQVKVLKAVAKAKPSEPPPSNLFNTRGAGARKHTLTDLLSRGLVAAKAKGAALDYTLTPLGAQVLKLASKGQNVAKLPPSGYRKALPEAPRRRRVA